VKIQNKDIFGIILIFIFGAKIQNYFVTQNVSLFNFLMTLLLVQKNNFFDYKKL